MHRAGRRLGPHPVQRRRWQTPHSVPPGLDVQARRRLLRLPAEQVTVASCGRGRHRPLKAAAAYQSVSALLARWGAAGGTRPKHFHAFPLSSPALGTDRAAMRGAVPRACSNTIASFADLQVASEHCGATALDRAAPRAARSSARSCPAALHQRRARRHRPARAAQRPACGRGSLPRQACSLSPGADLVPYAGLRSASTMPWATGKSPMTTDWRRGRAWRPRGGTAREATPMLRMQPRTRVTDATGSRREIGRT